MKLDKLIRHEALIAEMQIELYQLLFEAIAEYNGKQLNKRFASLLNDKLTVMYKGDLIPADHWLYKEGKRNFSKVTAWMSKTDYKNLSNHYQLTINFAQVLRENEKTLKDDFSAYTISSEYSSDSYQLYFYSFDTLDELKQKVQMSLEANKKRLEAIKNMNVEAIEKAYTSLLIVQKVYNKAIEPIGYRINKFIK